MSSKVMTFIDDETRRRLEFICKTEGRKMSNMLAFLINDYYNRLEIEKHKINPEEDLEKSSENRDSNKEIKEYRKPPSEIYQKILELKGSNIWSGDLEQMRANREFNSNDNS